MTIRDCQHAARASAPSLSCSPARGVLIYDSKRDRFQSGDLLFVAAGTEHQFIQVLPDAWYSSLPLLFSLNELLEACGDKTLNGAVQEFMKVVGSGAKAKK